MFGDAGPEAQARVLRGHAVLASFKRGAGEVFNTGTTEWAHGLKAGDPFVETITHNVMRRFGVTRHDPRPPPAEEGAASPAAPTVNSAVFSPDPN